MEEAGKTDYKALMSKALIELRELRAKLHEGERAKTEPIAIIGMGCRYPGGVDSPEEYWKFLCAGRDGISEVPGDRWDIDAYYDPDPQTPGKMACRYGGFLKSVDTFDASFFGITPRELVGVDPQQRLLLEVAWEALEHAGQAAEALYRMPAGVFIGISSFDYAAAQLMSTDIDHINAYLGTGIALSAAAGRLSYALGVTGPSMAVDTACSSSLVAMHLACQSLRSRECDLALAGGVNVILLPELSINFSRAAMLSPDGRCKTFDASADGYVRGEGCGVIVLKRLSDALSARDRILALVRGSAVNQDGPSGGLTVPSGPSQEAVIRRALANAGVRAGEVSYIEAHGTGTSLGDPIEVGALGQVFGGRSETDPLIIGSVKTHIGHLEAAAGIAGVMKVVLALQRAQIPSHLHFKNPNPRIAWEQLPFEIPTQSRKWPEGKKRIAGISSFGFTGTNAHIVLEEAPVFETRSPNNEPPYYLLALSARDAEALKALAGRYAAHIGDHPQEAIGDVCHTANTGRSHFEERLAVIGASGDQIAAGCRAFQEGHKVSGNSARKKLPPGKIAFLFSGPGSEYAGMGRDLYETAPEFRAALDRCDAVVKDMLHTSLIEGMYAGGKHRTLGDVAHDVQAVFSVQVALFELWKSWGIEPSWVMGYGVGEYAAACAAGGIGIEGGMRLVAEWGRLIGGTGKTGNSTVPSQSALSAFRKVAAGVPVETPRIGMVSCLTGELMTGGISWPDYWGRHVAAPTAFAAGLETLRKEGCGVFIEVGPDSVLLDRGRACLPDGYGTWLPSLQTNRNDWERMIETLGELYTAGITPDWRGVDRGRKRNKIALPTYPFQRQRYWIEGRGKKPPVVQPVSSRRYHPLLGQRLPAAHPDILFESHISPDSPSFLSDHRIYGQVVFPATGYVEMALAGGFELLESPKMVTIETFSILRPLMLSGAERLAVQTIFHPEADGGYSFEILSETSPEKWRRHATGRIRSGREEDIRPESLAALKMRCGKPLSVEDHYRGFAKKGISYGPCFQGIEQLMGAEEESLGCLRASATVEGQMSAYRLHPGFFDAGLQAASAILSAGTGKENQLPVGFNLLKITSATPASVLWSHARLRSSGPAGESREFDFCLYDDTGRARIQVEGFKVKRATRETLLDGVDGRGALYEVIWEPAPLTDEAGGISGHWVIFADGQGLGDKIAEALRARGTDTSLVYRGDSYRNEGNGRYGVNPLAPEAFKRLFAEALAGGEIECRGIVHLWSLDSGNEMNSASIEQGKILGCGSVLHLLQALSGVAVSPRVWLVTQGAQAAGESAQPVSVHQSPLWGFQRVIALEHPEFRSVCIDLDPRRDPREWECLLKEFCHSQGADARDWIAYRDGVRYGAGLVGVERQETRQGEHTGNSVRIRPDATYWITGGLGALGCLIAERLMQKGAVNIVLSGRNPAGPGVADTIERLKGEGAHIVVMPGDISKEEAVAVILERIGTSLPPLAGIIHAAGVLDDGIITEQTWERFARVMSPKIDGAWNLYDQTRDRHLDFFLLFSSTASGLGSPGQSNYAAANAFLDAMAHDLRKNYGCPATTINWGPWGEVGMAASHGEAEGRYAKQGVRRLRPAEGLALFDCILAGDSPQVYAADIDWTAYGRHFPIRRDTGFLAHLLKGAVSEDGKAGNQPVIRQKLAEAAEEKRVTLLHAAVIDAARKVMDHADAGRIRTDQPLMEQGLDSLMSVELRNILSAGLDIPLPVGLLFDYPSLDELCRYLAGLLRLDPENTLTDRNLPAAGDSEDEFAYIDEIDPEELEKMIKKEIG